MKFKLVAIHVDDVTVLRWLLNGYSNWIINRMRKKKIKDMALYICGELFDYFGCEINQDVKLLFYFGRNRKKLVATIKKEMENLLQYYDVPDAMREAIDEAINNYKKWG